MKIPAYFELIIYRRNDVLDLPPFANSFQRLLVHRIADRFRLSHSPSDTVDEVRI